MTVEIVLDGAYGRWADGAWIEPPALEPAREREFLRRLRQPASDPSGWRSEELEGKTGSVIVELVDELQPGSAEHLAAVVRTMGGEASIV